MLDADDAGAGVVDPAAAVAMFVTTVGAPSEETEANGNGRAPGRRRS